MNVPPKFLSINLKMLVPKNNQYYLIKFVWQSEYKNWLAAQIGLPPLEEWRENMLKECIKKLIETPTKYRDQWDDAYWNAIIQTTPTP